MHFNGFCQLPLRLHGAAETAVASKNIEIHKKVNILVLNAYFSAANASDNNNNWLNAFYTAFAFHFPIIFIEANN